MPACSALPGDGVLAQSVIGFLDCQARTMGAAGYQALSAPGSTGMLLLSGLLTLFVALFGYRMILGEVPRPRDATLAIIKVGLVLTLATAWPAYQALVYDVVLTTPADLASSIGSPSGIAGATGGLVARLDGADAAFERLAIYGVGAPQPDATGLVPLYAPPLFLGFDTFALGASRAMFLTGALASFILVRLGAGLMLAMGPIFVSMLLFDATRSLFESWLRGLLMTALGALAIAIVLGVELSLLEPWLSDLLARRASDIAIPGVPAQLLAVSTAFALALASLILVMAAVAFGFRLPAPRRWSLNSGTRDHRLPATREHERAASMASEARSRALVIADAVAQTQRREALAMDAPLSRGASRRISVQARSDDFAGGTSARFGDRFRRRTSNRVSAASARRDGRA